MLITISTYLTNWVIFPNLSDIDHSIFLGGR